LILSFPSTVYDAHYTPACRYLQLQGLLSHGKGAVEGLVASNEPSCVNEHTSLDTRYLVKLCIAYAFPSIREVLAVLEAAVLLAHSADAPLALGLILGKENIQDLGCNALRELRFLLESVEVVGPWHTLGQDQDAALGIVLQTVVVGGLDIVAGGKPRLCAVRDLDRELLANELGRLQEALVLSRLLLLCCVGLAGGGAVVEAADNAGNAEAAVLELLLDASLLDVLGREDVDAVIVGIEGLDEVGVDLLKEEVAVGALWQARHSRDDVLAEVEVDQAGRGKLGGVAGEDGVEAALVVVVALCVVIILATDIDDGVAFGKLGGVAGANELGVGVCGEVLQHGNSQRLVGVEVATAGVSALSRAVRAIGLGGERLLVCSDLDGGHVDLLRGVLCGHGAVVMSENGAQGGSAGVDGGL
jgi:hypothetical protein